MQLRAACRIAVPNEATTRPICAGAHGAGGQDVQLDQLEDWREHIDPADRDALDALGELLRKRWRAARKRMLRSLDSLVIQADWLDDRVDRLVALTSTARARRQRLGLSHTEPLLGSLRAAWVACRVRN